MNPFQILIVMAKQPVPGLVKTRLTPRLTPESAAELYRCLFDDRIRQMAELTDIDVAVAYTPEAANAYFTEQLPDTFKLIEQKGLTLSEKLTRLFADRFAEGYEAVSVIDSDTPELTADVMARSFKLLASHDLVFGPSRDGGYYLVGMKALSRELFHDIPWSSSDVLQTSLRKAEHMGLKTALLTELDDIDTYDDLVDFYQRFKRYGDQAGPGIRAFRYLANHVFKFDGTMGIKR